jgi:hypothetical protein
LVCQKTQILLMGTTGVIIIPLSIKGCVGELFLQAGEPRDGRSNDLSAFGGLFGLGDWTIHVNGALAFEGAY